jgi:glycerol kinase
MLFNINTLKWDDDICEMLDIPMCMLPTPVSNSEVYGESAPEYLGGCIKICGAAGDQQAALFGEACYNEGDIKSTYSTTVVVHCVTGDYRKVKMFMWGRGWTVIFQLHANHVKI